VPKAVVSKRSKASHLFDHLVGAGAMIDLLAVEEPKPKPAKIRAVSYEAAIDQLFKRMRS